MQVVTDPSKTEEVVKEIFWLAYNACGGPSGMGVFQARSEVSKEQVWNNVRNEGDYPGSPRNNKSGEAYGDYVFGKMMKLRVTYDEKTGVIDVPNMKPDISYQSWGRKYSSYEQLFQEACKNFTTEEAVNEALEGTEG